jgi:hypothetical protein
MALARIITRSQACSRELALDLLARGYAVEIVSPDKIPDNIADLELRVDAGPGDQLIATVQSHDGDRSASLDFVHHLKAPMVDFMRRAPEPREAVYFPEEPVSFDAEPSIEIEDVELPAAVPQLAFETISIEAEASSDPELDAEAGTRLISPLNTFPSLEIEPPIRIAEEYLEQDSSVESTPMRPAIVQPMDVPPIDAQPIDAQPINIESIDSQPTTESQPTIVWSARKPQPNRSARSFRRDALIFASVMLMALVLGYGIRRSDSNKASTQNSGALAAGKTETVAAASTGVNLLNSTSPEGANPTNPKQNSGQDAVTPASALAPPPAIKSKGDSGQVAKERPVAKPVSAAKKHSIPAAPNKTSHKHSDDLIAHDTVTYLDKRFQPAPTPKSTKKLAHKHPASHKQGGVVAANSVTYLNNKPVPKTAKQN